LRFPGNLAGDEFACRLKDCFDRAEETRDHRSVLTILKTILVLASATSDVTVAMVQDLRSSIRAEMFSRAFP
jgi:hypothetical protein